MDVQRLHHTDWIQAATRAHMVLSQLLSDEALDALVADRPAEPVVAGTARAA